MAERLQQSPLLAGDSVDIAFTIGNNDRSEYGGLELSLRDFQTSGQLEQCLSFMFLSLPELTRRAIGSSVRILTSFSPSVTHARLKVKTEDCANCSRTRLDSFSKRFNFSNSFLEQYTLRYAFLCRRKSTCKARRVPFHPSEVERGLHCPSFRQA